ncbi:MAG: hypothetical protein MUO62_05625 [Anaerolineales bacterium]|nr:hypothetical protein [Anaerolineales bacterium]
MKKNDSPNLMYSIGENIVHAHYGVGEIIRIEDKELFGKTTTYYVVKTNDSTFWLPIEKADNERTRPIVSAETIQDQVIEVLEAGPQEMASHYKTRRKRIEDVIINGGIVPIAELVRDLYYRKTTDSLTTIESRSYDRLKKRLITEWAKSVGTTTRTVNTKIQKILQRHREEMV